MSSTLTPHPDSEMLLRLMDADLPQGEWQQVDRHLAGCRVCQHELEGIREALGDYQLFHEGVLKTTFPEAPRPWDRLDVLAARTRGPQPSLFPRWRWMTAAAFAAGVVLAVWILDRPPAARAAELLRKAAAAEAIAPVRSRSIRMKSGRYRVDRPARVGRNSTTVSGDAVGIRQMLESAGYSWEDPLSAGAFARWHDALAQKQDRVEAGAQAYIIHTSTASSPISDASLKLSPDLHAVSCTLRFGTSDTVEMTEIEDAEPPKPVLSAPAVAPLSQPAPATLPAQPIGPGEELEVLSALHRIGADLGEPIDVRRDRQAILVNVTGLAPQRQEEVRSALAALPAARLQFDEPDRRGSSQVARRPATQVDTANPLVAELQGALADGASTADLADQLDGNTEKIIERVHALRGLARRFPPDVELQLTASEIGTLHRIVRDHAGAIVAPRDAIERLLKPILSAVDAPPVVDSAWQNIAEAMLAGTGRLDQAVNASGPVPGPRERKLAAARALAELERRLDRLHALVQP
jgi:hypothetical protein